MKRQLVGCVTIVCSLLCSSLCAAAEDARLRARTLPAAASVLLGSSQQVAKQADQARARGVRAALDLRLPDPERYLTSQMLRVAQGSEGELTDVEVQASPVAPVEEPIPYGLAAIYWGICHPSQSWRLLLPVPH